MRFKSMRRKEWAGCIRAFKYGTNADRRGKFYFSTITMKKFNLKFLNTNE